MPGDHPDQPAQQLDELGYQDDPERGPVYRRAPAGHRERVRVVELGQLLTGHDPAHTMITSFVHAGENPGAAGGTSSSRPTLICAAITPPAQRTRRHLRPPWWSPWRRAFPVRPRTGS